MPHPFRRLVPLLLIAALLAGAMMVRPTAATSVSEHCLGSAEQEFLTLINRYRAQNGLGQLAASQTLGAAAQHHALDMAATGDLTHTLSDGTTWLDNIINHGYPYGYRSENIAWGYASAQSVFDAWKASSGHNANMLNGGFGAIGIQRVYDAGAPYRYYWVTTFGSQLDAAAATCSGSTAPAPTATAAAPIATAVPPTATAVAGPPTAPSSLGASNKSQYVQLTWRDNAGTEAGYRVYRSADGGASWRVVADGLAANTTKLQDRDGLQKGQTYAYYVVAYNASGESAKSNTASVRRR